MIVRAKVFLMCECISQNLMMRINNKIKSICKKSKKEKMGLCAEDQPLEMQPEEICRPLPHQN